MYWGKTHTGRIDPLEDEFVNRNFTGEKWLDKQWPAEYSADEPILEWTEDPTLSAGGRWKTMIPPDCFQEIPPGNPCFFRAALGPSARPPVHYHQGDRKLCTMNSLRSALEASVSFPLPFV